MTDLAAPSRRTGWGPVVLVVAGVAAVATIAWGVNSGAPTTAVQGEAPVVQYAAVTRGDLVQTTSVQGSVAAGVVVALNAPGAGGSVSGSATGSNSGSNSGASGGAGGSGGSGAAGGSRPSGSGAATTTTIRIDPPLTTTTTPPPSSTTSGGPPSTAPTSTTGSVSTSTTRPTPTTTSAPPSTTSRPATPSTAGTTAPTATTVASTTAASVVTAVATVGTVLHSGDIAFAVNGRPSVVIAGATPAWRAIASTTSDGVDVRQLEAFLAARGFTDGGRLVVDGHVTSATTAAIDDWQTSLGVTATGSVALGEVSFQPAAVTVVAVGYGTGSIVQSGATIMNVQRGTPYVDVSTDASWAHVGATVTVSVSAGRSQGRITDVVSGIARVELAAASGARDGETATVTLTRVKVARQLLVPASAVLRSDVHGPTVVVRRNGSLHTVAVRVLAAADGTVAVRASGLAAGDEVRWY